MFNRTNGVLKVSPSDCEERYRNSELRRAFRPIFINMLLWGLDLAPDEETSCFRRFYAGMARFSIIIGQLTHGCMALQDLYSEGNQMNRISLLLTLSVISFEVVFIYTMFSMRKRKFVCLIRQLDESSNEILGNDPGSFRFIRWFTWTFTVLELVTVAILFIVRKGPHSQTKAEYAADTDWKEYAFRAVFQHFVINAFMLQSLFVVFFMCVSLTLRENYRQLCRQKAETSIYDWPASTTYLRHHDMLCCILRVMNKAFSEILLIWNFSEILVLIFILRAMDFGRTPLAKIHYEDVVLAFVTTVFFVIKSMCAAATNCKVMDTIEHLTEMNESLSTNLYESEKSSRRTSATRQEMKCRMYARYVQVDTPSLTGWGFYTIGKGLIWTAAANVMTYVLVLYSPKEIREK